MTRIYDAKGALVPVTIVLAGPCPVTQVKKSDGVDGYDAVQLAFEEVKPKASTFPEMGHAGRVGVKPQRFFREIRLDKPSELEEGSTVDVKLFEGVELVDVVGVSKGKGFQGVMKRHHFGGQPASHGCERKHRSPGSIASHATNRGHSGKPKKGLRMAGRMGGDRVTTRNHAIVKIVAEENLLVIKGALPGANGSLVIIQQAAMELRRKKAS